MLVSKIELFFLIKKSTVNEVKSSSLKVRNELHHFGNEFASL